MLMKNKLRDDVADYLPNVLLLIKNEPDWDTISDKLSQSEVAKHALQSNIYGLISLAEKKDVNALALIEYINILLREINSLPPYLKSQLDYKMNDILTEISDAKFKNYIGELAVLNALMCANQYENVSLEKGLGNGKFADFYLEEVGKDEKYYVEVVNLHLNETHHKNFKKGFRRKVVKKISEKTANSKIEIILIPVIWADIETLRKMQAAYDEGFKVKHVYFPFAFYASTDGKSGILDHHFKRLANLELS